MLPFRSVTTVFPFHTALSHLIVHDLRSRYRGTILGFFWTLLNPLLMMLVLWFVFQRFGRADVANYPLFLLSGVILWMFFQQCLERCLDSILSNQSLFLALQVPKFIFPLAIVTSNLINLLFSILAYFIIALPTDHGIPATAPAVLLSVLILYVMALGLSLTVATLNVFFRDVNHLTRIVLHTLFYITPIIYPPEALGPDVSRWLALNPVYHPIVLGREALYEGTIAEPGRWAVAALIAAACLIVGLVLFASQEEKFIYYS